MVSCGCSAALLLFLARRSLPLVFPGFDLQRIVSIPVAGRIPEIFEVKPPKTHALILLPMAFFMAPQAQVVDALCQNEYAKRWQRDVAALHQDKRGQDAELGEQLG